MNQITFPLKPRMKGPRVGELQAALQLLLDRDIISGDGEADRRDLSIALQRELARQTYSTATRKLVSIFQKERQITPSGDVDDATAGAMNRLLDELGGPAAEHTEFVVKGAVRLFDGFPAAGLMVSAFDRDLRSEEVLGQTQTDRQGFYEIRYSARQFRKAEKGSADLVVKAFAADGSLLAASPLLFNAPHVTEVDLKIGEKERLLTLFEKLGQALPPLLADLRVEELEEDREHQDLTFLSGETGFEKYPLARLVLAHNLAAEHGIQAEFWFALLGGSFFEYDEKQGLKENLARVSGALSTLDAAAVRKALFRGFNEKEISEAFREKVVDWIEAFLQIIARQSLSDAGPTFVKSALEHAGITNAEKQERFARLFNEYKALTPELLTALEQDRSFKTEEIDDLRTSFQLAELTQGDFLVVKTIKEEFEVRQPGKIRLLAKKSESEWVKLIKAKHAAGDITLPIEVGDVVGRAKLPEAEVYGKMLERRFREAFPTTAFSGGLERALQTRGVHGLRHAEALARFLEQHENFEFLNTRVDEFLENSIRPDFHASARDENFRLEVMAVQRVFKLAPTFEATDALLADDLHSAQKIYRMGETEFVRRYEYRPGFTPETARLAWDRAADIHAAALTLVADLKSLEGDALPLALKNNNEALSKFPNWDKLFGNGGLCGCEHCRSVLGPAAYFADLLMFLKDRRAKNPAQTVKDILFGRRPDLGFIELNCGNALTPLPYIDVVCEVLEDVVAEGENDLELPGFTAMPADAAAAKVAVASALAAQGISLGADFSLSQVNPSDPDKWVAHGGDVTCLLKKKATPNFFVEILRNTKAGAAELRTYPQYVNPKAYDKLKAASYPMTLPFDLFAEEVRTGFQKTNLQRWDLMRTLRGPAAPNNPTDNDIAAEYFDISISAEPGDPSEKNLILAADSSIAGQQTVWGETGASWLNTVGIVRNFLRKTGLEYNELPALLDLKFINPAGDIAIHHLDSSCDTGRKVIQVLDAVKLDRIHRFLRLWRKLKGWKMWELDLVIRHPRIGNGELDDPFLVNLFYFSRLRNRLAGKTTIEQVCALFDNLNIETRFTSLHEKRQDALYQRLFLNKRLINPLDPAFQLDPATGDLPAGETITGHHPAVLAALGIRESDLVLLKELIKASDSAPYITDDLTLANLSFLWRHAWLVSRLKFKAEEWRILLKICRQDIPHFSDPQAAWKFVEDIDRLKATGFTPDQLNWLLAADRSAKAAVKESDAARFLAALRKELQGILAEYDPGQYDFLTVTPPTDVDSLAALLTSLLQKLNRDEATAQFFIAVLRDEVSQEKRVPGMPANFNFPPTITGSPHTIRIRYDEPATTLRFSGMMTAAQRTTLLTDPSLAAVTGIAAYQETIEEFFTRPRLTLKFFEPVFTAPLANLPPAVDFKILPDPALSRMISYDGEERLLRVAGILSKDQKAALDALSADMNYRNAVNSLFTQPVMGVFPAERIWLQEPDLLLPLRDNPAKNLATATTKALRYLSRTLSENTVVQHVNAQLGLTEALTRRLLTHYTVLPDTLLAHMTGTFAATTGVVDYATLKSTFDGWFWAKRVAAIWKKWNITPADLDKIIALTTEAHLLDFLDLPLDDAGVIPSLDRFLRTSRLLRLRDSLPETGVTLLEALKKLSDGTYVAAADFAADVQHLNEAWVAADMEALIAMLDLNFPDDYLLAENWERLHRAFYFLGNLNAGADTVKKFAAPAMTFDEAKTLKELLRSKFGAETWLTLSAGIQDALRERKRDALAAYLLTRPKPADAPGGKWENTNDLYAYYLLDIEMSSCLLTSRLVQGSGSIQLFVQRCFMGLEPDVAVKTDGHDGDSAWRWWKWMRKYRFWEANRKVFLWPENWIEPELKKDRSQFFRDLENELLQNEINQYTVETAFSNYLEKLDGVAQLEIAGFYQEDDGDNTIIHVFGRTPGAEPHIYYYRRYDYRQWTPWKKVDLDIQGDYLIPAVVNKRLFLFWPMFTEVPDETENNKPFPIPLPGAAELTPKKTTKKLRLRTAVSEYRQDKWMPKRVSKDFGQSELSYTASDVAHKNYRFFLIDRGDADSRLALLYDGFSAPGSMPPPAGSTYPYMSGAFEIAGCKGVPELARHLYSSFVPVVRPESASTGALTVFLKWAELGANPPELRLDRPENDFTLENFFPIADYLRFTPVLMQTPWFFRMSAAWQASYFDRLLLNAPSGPPPQIEASMRTARVFTLGSWLPFFYNDKKRTFFVLPSLRQDRIDRSGKVEGDGGKYYPELKSDLSRLESFFAGQVQTWVDNFDLAALTPGQRQQMEQLLYQNFPEEVLPPYTDEQVKGLMKRFLMRFFGLYLGRQALQLFQLRRFHFRNFYHPFVCDFAKLVHNPLKGIPALMSRETQLRESGFRFRQSYQPTAWVVDPATEDFYPREIVDFTPDGSYSTYNWELFFHAPLLIANALSRNQRFEEARDWYHFIFNPLGLESAVQGGSLMSKYWITKPFFETTDQQYIQQRIDNILRMLAGDTSVPGYSAQMKKDIEGQVHDWRTNPFEPHRIANYRTVAYQKTVVMKYLDNLIAWGDYLFRQDSMESINEATQLYILAAEILGPRPKKIPPRARPAVESFNELEQEFDKFSNALIEVENLIPPLTGNGSDSADTAPLPMLYFCIPQNEKMLGYWDTVADRLHKIRNCMNIEGVVRQLALFEPPIEPGALVKAVAEGVDISSALADVNAPLPIYRFTVMLQKANEMCNDVKVLGSALLAALEKKDAESLSLLRQDQEIKVLEAVKAVREQQIAESRENLEGLKKSRELSQIKKTYYETRQFMNVGEAVALGLSYEAAGLSIGIQLAAALAGTTRVSVPQFMTGGAGAGGTPLATVTHGGETLADAQVDASNVLSVVAMAMEKAAAISGTIAGYQRRQDEWVFQRDLTVKEIEQLDKSIAAAELRVAIAEKELENHILQIDNAKATDDFMRSKYTNLELHQWQVGQISGVYFQSYRLAYDLAKRAERCFRFDLGLQDGGSYIQFGYWDSLKKGLLSGEKLQYDLRRLETAYLEQNRREFELTKCISLLLLDPLALVKLRETGRCFISLPEEIFDLDYPGHYFRRIESVSITLPCVVGPCTTVSCTLRLLKNSIRINTVDGDNGYPRNTDDQGLSADDDRFIEYNIPVKAIAASSAQNDSGVFELSFRDERYLPFEGAGAVSEWSLELFNDNNQDFGRPLRQFDYSTITDAILQVKYTARENAGAFKNNAIAHLREYFSQEGTTHSLRMFNLRQEFPTQWHRFLNPASPADGNVLEFEMAPDLFLMRDAGKPLKVNMIWVLARCTNTGSYTVSMTLPSGEVTMTLGPGNEYGGLRFTQKDVSASGVQLEPTDPPDKWRLKMTGPNGENLQVGEVEDVFLVAGYEWE